VIKVGYENTNYIALPRTAHCEGHAVIGVLGGFQDRSDYQNLPILTISTGNKTETFLLVDFGRISTAAFQDPH